ncbi:TrfB-related DNA-binding protein [Paraburkholderia tropica]|uniref:TrfB-related DNA-binding protein n=1 Tax=Paraburkholderia tropica TaxID=92647 RepID=UPI002AB67CA8|nr:TrfB-related DNA-binding protein [Paraburkholderia tropica]
MGRVSTKRLSAAAFARLKPWLTGLNENVQEVARRAMVEGQKQVEIAREFDITQQAVQYNVNTVWTRLEKAREAGFNPDEIAADVVSEDMGPAAWSAAPGLPGERHFTGRLKKDAWSVVEPGLGDIEPEPLAVARLAIVGGKTLRTIAEQHGWTQTDVRRVTEQVWKQIVHLRQSWFHHGAQSTRATTPPGWIQMAVPAELVDAFRAQIEQWRSATAAKPDASPARKRARAAR